MTLRNAKGTQVFGANHAITLELRQLIFTEIVSLALKVWK